MIAKSDCPGITPKAQTRPRPLTKRSDLVEGFCLAGWLGLGLAFIAFCIGFGVALGATTARLFFS